MQVSVRSYLAGGTVAVVAAGAVALTPAVVPMPGAVPAPAFAEVNLTALSLSPTDLIGLLQGLGIGAGLPEVLTALQALVPADIVTAVVDEFVSQAAPLVFAAAGDVLGYLGTAVTGLITGPDSIPVRFGDALAAIPGTLLTAVQSLGTGNLAAALQTVSEALSGPLAGITAVLTETGAAFEDFLTAEFNGLVGQLPGVLFAAVQTVVTANLQSLIDSITGALSGLFGGLIPGAGAAAAASVEVGTIVCNMPAVRTPAALPAAADLPVSTAPVTVEVSARAQAAEIPSEGRSAATISAARSRAAQPRPAAAAASVPAAEPAADISAAADTPAASKAGAVRSGRASAR